MTNLVVVYKTIKNKALLTFLFTHWHQFYDVKLSLANYLTTNDGLEVRDFLF